MDDYIWELQKLVGREEIFIFNRCVIILTASFSVLRLKIMTVLIHLDYFHLFHVAYEKFQVGPIIIVLDMKPVVSRNNEFFQLHIIVALSISSLGKTLYWSFYSIHRILVIDIGLAA